MNPAEGKYRIQTVAEMTGVPAATLRAWERRYGIPSPQRSSSSSYRLFSDDDVATIRRLKELCDAGMSPSEAARIASITAAPPQPESDNALVRARDTILRAVSDFDPTALQRSVRAAMFMGSANTVYEEILGPVMKTVGDRWHAGEYTVAQEHMATEAIIAAARDIFQLLEPQPNSTNVVLACFADEEHSLPLYGVAMTMLSMGFRPTLLGARTPPMAVRHAVEALQPALVALSVTVAPSPRRAGELIRDYADAAMGRPWVVGGPGTSELEPLIVAAGGAALSRQDPGMLRRYLETVPRQWVPRRT